MTQDIYTGPLVGIDTETTGVDCYSAMTRIVTCAVISEFYDESGSVNKGEVEWLLNPEIDIPTGASDVHGITTDIARANGMNYVQGIHLIAETIKTCIENRVPVVAYNASFDLTLIRDEIERREIDFDPTLWDNLIVIDPTIFDKVFDKWRKGKRTLSVVSGLYGYDLSNAHNATADVEATLHIARRMLARVSKMNGGELPPPEELMEYQIANYREQSEGLEAHFRKKDPNAVVNKSWPFQERPY